MSKRWEWDNQGVELHDDHLRWFEKEGHVEGGAIKLTKNDSPDGQHHFIPIGWVDHVDNHVHLRKNSEETKAGWKSDVAACSNCGA